MYSKVYLIVKFTFSCQQSKALKAFRPRLTLARNSCCRACAIKLCYKMGDYIKKTKIFNRFQTQQNTRCFIETLIELSISLCPVKKVPRVLPPFAIEDKAKTDLNFWGRDRSSFWLQGVGGGEPRGVCFIQKSPNFLGHNTTQNTEFIDSRPPYCLCANLRISFVSTRKLVCHLSSMSNSIFRLQCCHSRIYSFFKFLTVHRQFLRWLLRA